MDGEFVGEYRILRRLGSGAMGSVYLATHRDIPNLRTVLKKLGDPLLVDRFRLEADKLALLEGHRGVCQIKHFFDHEGQFYIVMEHIEGPTLQELIESPTPPDIARALEIVASLLETLAFAHQQGIVHRDIKPTNIMIDRLGQVKVIDFGIAKSIEDPDLTQAGTSLGSPRYMAPEQFNASPATDWVRCDLYAIGVTLYYLLTRAYPFDGETIYEIWDAKRKGLVSPPSTLNGSVTNELDRVVLKAVATDPADRFASAADMLAAMREAQLPADPHCQTTPFGDPHPPDPERIVIPGPPEPQVPVARIMSIAGAVVVAAIIVVVALQSRHPDVPAQTVAPRAPELLAPGPDEVLADQKVTFRWTAPADGTRSMLELAPNPAFTGSEVHSNLIGGSMDYRYPLQDGVWYWRVRASPEGSPWSEPRRFSVKPPRPDEATVAAQAPPTDRESAPAGPSRGEAAAQVTPKPTAAPKKKPDGGTVPVRILSLIDGASVNGATIAIDGRMLDDQTPFKVVDFPTGKHTVTVSLEVNGVRWVGRTTVDVTPDMADYRLRIPLAPPP